MPTTIGATKVTAMPPDLGGRLRYLREQAGLSPERIALEIGLRARVIGDWECNYRTPRLVYLRQLARLYHVPITTLVDVDTTPKKSPPVSPEEMREWVAASRAKQRLPPTIQEFWNAAPPCSA